MDNRTIIQYFEWYVSGHHVLWKKCAAQAFRLAEFGITEVWLPPAYKAGFMEDNVGYAAYDLYDLGEFDQKGMVPTKYGTKEEYLIAVKAFHQAGIKVLADVVMNHKIGADAFEEAEARCVNPGNRMEFRSDRMRISAPTRFTFPGRRGKYSTFTWNHTHFTGVDWDQYTRQTGHVYKFEGQEWAQDVSRENGNFDFLMGADIAVNNPEVREELIRWGKWYLAETGVDGFRLDAVKHLSAGFVRDWLREMRGKSGNLPAIGEFWHGDVRELENYLEQVEGSLSLFDVPLHFRLRDMSYADGRFDMRQIFRDTLLQRCPENAVTFVDNHDSQPGQALESFCNVWLKQVLYALILLHKDGVPCIFYGDLYGIPTTRSIPVPRIRTLVRVRRDCAYGAQHDYIDDFNVIGWTREGDAGHPRSGLALLVSDKIDGAKRMYVGRRFAGTVFKDCMRKLRNDVVIDAEGYGDFTVQGASAAVWVPLEEYEELVIHED